MSTAIDYSSLLKKAKQKKQSSPASNPVSQPLSFSVKDKFDLLQQYLLPSNGLNRAFYVPNFITEEEEQFALQQIYSAEDSQSAKWVQLSHRRLKVYGGTPDYQSTFTKPLPKWIQNFITNCLVPTLKTAPNTNSSNDQDVPNHVLLNEYSEGMGIAPHCDGPLYHDRVAVLNLQSPALIHFYHIENDQKLTVAFSVYLEPRSLLVFEDDLYTNLKHGIPNSMEDDLSQQDKLVNIHLLSEKTRNLLSSPSTSILSRGTLPRLSLTIRKLKNSGKRQEDDLTQAEKDDLKRAEVNFYRNVSEYN